MSYAYEWRLFLVGVAVGTILATVCLGVAFLWWVRRT